MQARGADECETEPLPSLRGPPVPWDQICQFFQRDRALPKASQPPALSRPSPQAVTCNFTGEAGWGLEPQRGTVLAPGGAGGGGLQGHSGHLGKVHGRGAAATCLAAETASVSSGGYPGPF